jgi:hypothetical protein
MDSELERILTLTNEPIEDAKRKAWHDRAMTGDGRWLEYAMDVVRGTGIGDVAEGEEGFNRKPPILIRLIRAMKPQGWGHRLFRWIGPGAFGV